MSFCELMFFVRCIFIYLFADCSIMGNFVAVFVSSATYYCFNKYFTLKETHPNDGDIKFTVDFQYYIDLYQTWLVLGTC